jgi:GDP-4-dehydro-6-deoxy-D-mannose reductase
MKVLVTGANGFAGGWLVRRLLADGHEVLGAAGGEASTVLARDEHARVAWRPLDLEDGDSIRALAAETVDAVAHLAGLASVGVSFADPLRAWSVNAVGTVRLLEALVAGRAYAAGQGPRVLLVSSAEVYGPLPAGDPPRPRRESDALAPVSPYAASKAAAELAGLETWRRAGLRVVVARPFPHAGPGQGPGFLVPGLVDRVRKAREAGRRGIPVGNLAPVRDLLDVRDVAAAYAALLAHGVPGETYNVAGGRAMALADLLRAVCARLDWAVSPEPDPALARPTDIPHLVGDPARLRALTGWEARHSMDDMLDHLLDAAPR